MTGIGTNDKYQHKGETAYFMEMQKMRQYGCAGVNVHGRIGGNMDRFFLITTLMMMSMTMLFASNAYLAQGAMAPVGVLTTFSTCNVFVSGVTPISAMINLCNNFTVKKTKQAAQGVAGMCKSAKRLVSETVISVAYANSILVSG